MPATPSGLPAVTPHSGLTDDMPPSGLIVSMPRKRSCGMPATHSGLTVIMPPYGLPDDVRSNNRHATKVVLQHACHPMWSYGRRTAQRTHRQRPTTVVPQPACRDSGLTACLPRGAVLWPPCHPSGLTVAQRSLPATQSGLTAVVPRLGFTDDMPPLRSYSLTVGIPPEWSCNMPATRE